MYIISAQPLNFSYGFRPTSSRRTITCNANTCQGILKNARHGHHLPFITYRISWKFVAGRGKLDVPQVCSEDGRHYEVEAINKTSKMEESIEYVKKMLQSIGEEGRISVSPYDTAWVALISNGDVPQFPSTLEWIANNQHSDGSWGDESLFLACDRLICTLACVVALRSWNLHPSNCEKENISKVDRDENKTCGFEILFTSLLQRAETLGIEGLPYDAPVTHKIRAERDHKLQRISEDKVASSLLILEGLEKLEWQKLLKLQSPDGSILNSPSTTAFAFMETKDDNCFKFLYKIVEKFNGGAPPAYPVDFFARIWAADRLQRLGISRFFDAEIDDCLSYIYRFWTGQGGVSGEDSGFCDYTSMCFRLLRLQGYNVNPNVFKNFKKGNKFSLYSDEMIESPSPIFNLYRASQLQFPGEAILEEAREISRDYLQQTVQRNPILDICLISKHLPNEIRYGLEMPFYASLPRVEARLFIENYGVDEVWIGKSLYRMPDINDSSSLELAKLDYNRCQTQHQIEWNHMQQWHEDHNLDEQFGIRKNEVLCAYFLAAASIFEPERTGERLAWVKSQIVSSILSTSYFIKEAQLSDHTIEFSTVFGIKIRVHPDMRGYKNIQRIITILFETLDQLKKDAQARIGGGDGDDLLHEAWGGWLKKQGERAEEREEVEVVVRTINICAGNIVSKEILSHHDYKALSALTNKICNKLRQFQNHKMIGTWDSSKMDVEIDKEMQLLVQLVVEGSISKDIKQTFLVIAKTFYYRVYFPTKLIEDHIAKVLFDQLV